MIITLYKHTKITHVTLPCVKVNRTTSLHHEVEAATTPAFLTAFGLIYHILGKVSFKKTSPAPLKLFSFYLLCGFKIINREHNILKNNLLMLPYYGDHSSGTAGVISSFYYLLISEK